MLRLTALFSIPCVMLTLMACAPASGGDGADDAGAGGSGAVGGSAGGAVPGGSDRGGAAAGVAGAVGGSTAGGGQAGGAGGSGALAPGAISSVALGSCAIGRQGNVVCWGVYPNMPGAFAPPAGSFTRVVGGSFLCAQRSSGELGCFNQPASNEPLDGVPTTPVTDFAISVTAMCWLDQPGNVACLNLDTPTPPDLKLSRIAVGRSFACGIRLSDSGITCWGDDGANSAACGVIPPTGQLDAPSGTFTAIGASLFNACALRTDGTVACWGAGDATDDPNATFCNDQVNFGQSQPPPDHFTQISVGESHACGVKTDGSVACWGAGTKKGDCSVGLDQCGQAAPPAAKFAQVAAGRSHTCGMHADRTVECWGSNTGGRATPPTDFP